MRTNFVLIDFESVQPKSLAALEQDCFKVIVFVGASQAKVPFELATSLQRMGDKAQYIKIAGNGRNALDFHIAFYLGQLAVQDPTAFFHVISKDTGFDPLIQHLKTRKIFCVRSPTIEDIPLVKAGDKKSPDERAQLIAARLQQPKVTRPRTVKTLSSSIAAFFQKRLADEDVAAIIAAMQQGGFISVADGKVSYAPDGIRETGRIT